MSMHVMLDLETWGARPGSALRSIGAVTFDVRLTDIGETFYRNIDKQSCLAAGLTIDPDTAAWWDRQSPESLATLEDDQRALSETVDDFHEWFSRVGAQFIWSQGGNFDEPLWAAASRAVEKTVPWKYWDARCTRTIYDAAGFNFRLLARYGVHHNALDDAIHQARCVQHAMALIHTQLPHNKTRSEHSGSSS